MKGEGAWRGRSLLEGLAGHLDEGQHQGAQRERAKAGAQREPGRAQRAPLQRIRRLWWRKVPAGMQRSSCHDSLSAGCRHKQACDCKAFQPQWCMHTWLSAERCAANWQAQPEAERAQSQGTVVSVAHHCAMVPLMVKMRNWPNRNTVHSSTALVRLM